MLLNVFAVVAPICFFIGLAVAIKWICIGISKAYKSAKTAISDYIADFTDENYTKFRRDVDRMKHGGEPDCSISEIRGSVLFAFVAEDILRRIANGKTVSMDEVKEALKRYDDFWETKDQKDELKRRGRRGNSHVQSLKGK